MGRRVWEAPAFGFRGGRVHHAILDALAHARMLLWRAQRVVGGARSAPLDGLEDRFRRIHAKVRCAHSLAESLYIMDMVLAHAQVPGAIVECGVFKGGMTAKLSLLARRLDRRLFAYDSYEGLPDPSAYGTGEQVPTYARKLESGDSYRGGLPEVRANLAAHGDLARCVLVKGWFEESFARGDVDPDPIAFAFVDVDLSRSLRQCLQFIVPRLAPGSILFCHEARDPEIVAEIRAEGLLDLEHRGVGTGLGEDMPNLCWIRKRAT